MKILNFGSLNIDDVYTMEHFVRPGETASSLDFAYYAGGKGLNQSIALANAGAEVYHAGAIGKDGLFLKELLQEKGVHTDFVQVSDTRTGHAIIQVEQNGQNCIILYGGANRAISLEVVRKTLSHFEKGDYLLLQNEINANPWIVEESYAMGMNLVLNPSPFDSSIAALDLQKISCFLLNEIEGEELSGEKEPERMMAVLRERYPSAKIVLTLGKSGVIAFDGEKICSHGIYDVPVIDTTAAGDTFTGFLLTGLMQGMPMQECLGLASKASSLAIGRKGASNSIPTMKEVLEADLRLV